MMYVGGVGTPEATVNIAGLVSGVVVSPDQVILDEGQQAEEMVGVSYRVPTTATVGSTLLVPVAYRSNAGSGHVPLRIRVVDGSQTRKE
ncbi:MAG: hypothetical protein EOO74_10760 [Myxococcales bacterium]|nr:MAG: hypothetical protein EOO74_10760 [Myxococcales bacterium]